MTNRVVVVLLAALILLAAVPAHAGLQAVAPGPYLAAYGFFPAWYQDTTGKQLELCLSKAESPNVPPSVPPSFMCLLSAPDLAAPLAFPNNFGDENFWFTADAIMDTQSGLSMILVQAVEAAFSTGDVVNGAQITFARIRLRIDVPAPGTGTYTVTYPYGQRTFTNPGPGGRAINDTVDAGLGGPPFAGVLGGEIGPFLQAASAPGGTPTPTVVGAETFVGDPNIEQFVTGSPNGTNYFRVEGPGIGTDPALPCNSSPAPADPNNCVETKLFAVSGKVFDGRLPTNVLVDRSTYSRSAAGSHIDVFATSTETATLSFRDSLTGGTTTAMTGDGSGKFYGQQSTTSIPSFVYVTATDAATNPGTLASPVVDVVKITLAQYALDTKTLRIEATSSDQVSPPTLRAIGFSTLTSGVLNTSPVAEPPARVTVVSSQGGRDTEPVQIVPTLVAANRPPTAGNDSASTLTAVAVNIAVLANDSDPDSNLPLTVANLTQPANGTAALNADQTVTYTSNAGFTGTDTFTYQAQDSLGELSNVATVTVIVQAPNVNPTALNDSANTPQAQAVTVNVLFNDSDPDGNTPLTVVNLTQPANGTAAVVTGGVRYTPALTFFGTDTFTYQAQDTRGGLSNVATVTINVQKAAPVAVNDSATTNFETPVTINVLANDTGGAVALAPAGLTQPVTATGASAGTTAIQGTQVVYTPAAGFSGTATFRYQALDSLNQLSNSALVTVNVNPSAVETITASASARIVVKQGVQSTEWTINGTVTPRSPSVTIRLVRTQQQIGGVITTDTKGRFKLSLKGSPITPVAGDQITVRTAAGTEATFPLSVR